MPASSPTPVYATPCLHIVDAFCLPSVGCGPTARISPNSHEHKPTPFARSVAPATAADFQPLLDAHNAYRATHQAAPLAWNSSLAAVAQFWADGCPNGHNPNLPSLGFGENIWFGSAGYTQKVGWLAAACSKRALVMVAVLFLS
jgi:hypothetical protein